MKICVGDNLPKDVKLELSNGMCIESKFKLNKDSIELDNNAFNTLKQMVLERKINYIKFMGITIKINDVITNNDGTKSALVNIMGKNTTIEF